MAKKIIIISSFPVCIVLVVLAIVFVGIGRGQPAVSVVEPQSQLQVVALNMQQAQGYFENSDYQQAEQIYQDIVKQCPDADQALEAQKGLVMVYISWGKQAEAETAYQQLLSNFPHNTHMADVIHHGIASHYRKCKKDDKADENDKYVLSHWPSTESAMWAQVDIAGASINRKDYAAAQAGIDNLFAGFANSEHLCDAIHSVAYRYRQSEKTAKADELDKYVLNHWPSTESAMWSQVDIINSNIDSKDYASAQTGIDSLLTRFSSNENMANVLHGMAYKYRQAQQTAKADELDQYVLDNWPSSEIALWARVDIINSNIDSKDYTAAQTGIDNLLARFSSNENMSNVLQRMAYKYRQAQQTAKADELDQYVLDNWPSSKIALWARMDMALSNVASLINDGNDSEAQAALDKLLTEFAKYPDLPNVVLQIAEPYWNEALRLEGKGLQSQAKDYFRKALRVAEIAKDKCPNYVESADTLYWTGICYRGLGEYEKSIQRCRELVNNWPDFKCAWQAQFLIGCNYEELKTSGAISEAEANTKAKAAYEELLKNYPDCPAAESARSWLNLHNSEK